MNPRELALRALVRIEREGAYANLVVPAMLDRTSSTARDRAFVTELVYGTTRMRRACDWLVDRFVLRELDPPVRAVLRLGAYQLVFLGTPPHAAVSATVDVAPARAKGLVNGVLRRVAGAPATWPDAATQLSYPDWIVARLIADLGEDAAMASLTAMNAPAPVTERPDGYVQDLASRWVAELVDAGPGMRVADVCAAPGGKATALASTGATVVAADRRPSRARLVVANAGRLAIDGGALCTVVADARQPPFLPGSFDRVLVDAPCSGLGALRRRPDARWRIEEGDVERLAELQRELVDAAVPLLRPGGVLVYSACTLTAAESLAIDDHLEHRHPHLEPLVAPAPPWQPYGRGARLLPHSADTDGMVVLRLRLPVRYHFDVDWGRA